MPKRKKASSLPPEGLWISPEGERHDINEHLMAIRERPEDFGLSLRDVAGQDIDGLRRVAEDLIGQGWTRYRYLDGRYHFEVDSATRRMRIIEDVLMEAQAHQDEEVWISQVSPPQEYQGKVSEVYDRVIIRFQKKHVERNKWRFSKVK